MKASIFKTYTGVVSFFGQDFDFDIRCGIQSYEVIYQARLQDPIVMNNQGSSFSAEVQKVVQRAKAGDTYIFREIKARCPGDAAARSLPSLIVMVK